MTAVPERLCTTCRLRGVIARASFVVENAGRLQWFECDEHGPEDNHTGEARTGREPIDEWFARVLRP